MKIYVYTDKSTKELLLEVEADNILQADKVFKEALGFDVSKKANIGCSIETIGIDFIL